MGKTSEKKVQIVNKRGLHARAAAKFVQLCEKLDAEVEVTSGDLSVSGTSIMGLLMLGAAEGTELILHAKGKGAASALDQIEKLVSDRFGEEC